MLKGEPWKLNDVFGKRAFKPLPFRKCHNPDVAALIQAACVEAARVEREHIEALAIQHIQQQKSEDDASHESERAAWAQQAQAGLEVEQQTLLERLKAPGTTEDF
jgi:hypothetical protein